jgi:sulfate permease, SulP family
MSKSSVNKPLLTKFSRYIPALDWLLNYRSQYLVGDITAGIIVTSLLIPQSMAYALQHFR